ncbi:centromere protein S isoform X2 [Procambarus clarkii]|uniref:centromere protein S isoform X2 n=1 Tax=Procambarus clarkii TaxID=6728 RepID=UPI001E67071F|nr:centromere protein S-like isoform X2 [Procambarus clarkii]
MAADDVGELNHVQTLKAAIHFTVGRTCEEIGVELGLSFSKHVIATLSEITCKQLETYSADLEAFANHARRAVINTDDVKLLVRRNPDLTKHIKEMADSMEQASGKERKKRGRKPKNAESPAEASEQTTP